jgi:hypothetical protein
MINIFLTGRGWSSCWSASVSELHIKVLIFAEAVVSVSVNNLSWVCDNAETILNKMCVFMEVLKQVLNIISGPILDTNILPIIKAIMVSK